MGVRACVCVQGGRRDEDHEYGEAAQDHPHYSEPDGRPPGFQCESKGEASHRSGLPLGSRARVQDSLSISLFHKRNSLSSVFAVEKL